MPTIQEETLQHLQKIAADGRAPGADKTLRQIAIDLENALNPLTQDATEQSRLGLAEKAQSALIALGKQERALALLSREDFNFLLNTAGEAVKSLKGITRR